MARNRPGVADFIMKDISAMNDYFIKVVTFELNAADVEVVAYKLLLRVGQAELLLYWHTRTSCLPAGTLIFLENARVDRILKSVEATVVVYTETSGVMSSIEVSGHTYHFVKMTIEIDILAFTILLQHGR